MADIFPLLVAVLVLAAAAFIQSATGFGMALVCMAGLPLIMNVTEAVSLVAAFNLLVTANIMWWNRSGFSWPKAWPIVIPFVIGIPLGFYLMKGLDPTLVVRSLGLILIIIAATDLRMSSRRQQAGLVLPGWSVLPFSFGGGLLGGAFNVGGPPVVAYVYSQNWSKAQSVAVLQTAFLFGGVTRNLLMGLEGDYSRELFITMAWAIVPAALAVWMGKRTLDRLPQDLLRRIVFIFVLAMGIKYLLWP